MKKTSLCLMAAFLFLTGCVEPQKIAVLENRVAAIEMENNRELTRQKAMSKEAAAENEESLTRVEEDLRQISGTVNSSHLFSKEEYAQLKYDIRTLREEIQKIQGQTQEMKEQLAALRETGMQDIDARMQRLDDAISTNYEKVIRLEKHMGFEPTAAGTEPVEGSESPIDPVIETPRDPEQEAYASAKKLFDEGHLENARIHFENFITKYPESKNADNARFWIADSYYSEKRFAEAILEYQKVLETYSDSNKLAAARLKQGYAFAELGEQANARLILKELLKKYPDSQEARFAEEKLKNLQ